MGDRLSLRSLRQGWRLASACGLCTELGGDWWGRAVRICSGLVPNWGQAPVRGANYGWKPRKFAILGDRVGDCPQLGGSLAPQGILISRRAAESQREGLSPIGGSLAPCGIGAWHRMRIWLGPVPAIPYIAYPFHPLSLRSRLSLVSLIPYIPAAGRGVPEDNGDDGAEGILGIRDLRECGLRVEAD